MEEKLKTGKSRRKYKRLRSQGSTTDGEHITTSDGGRRRIGGDVRCSVTQGKETEV